MTLHREICLALTRTYRKDQLLGQEYWPRGKEHESELFTPLKMSTASVELSSGIRPVWGLLLFLQTSIWKRKQFRSNFYFQGMGQRRALPQISRKSPMRHSLEARQDAAGCDGQTRDKYHLCSSSIIFLHPHVTNKIYCVRVCTVGSFWITGRKDP